MVKYERNKNIKNVANFKNLSVKYDRKNNQLYIVYTEDYPGTKMGVEVVIRDGYVMPFKYVQAGGIVSRDYTHETFKDYGKNLKLCDVLKLLGIDSYDENHEFEFGEVQALEVLMNEKLKESFVDAYEVTENGTDKWNFMKKGDVYLAKAEYDENDRLKGIHYLVSLDNKNVLVINLETRQIYRYTNEGMVPVAQTFRINNLKSMNVSSKYFSDIEDVYFFTKEVLEEKLKTKNASQPANNE